MKKICFLSGLFVFALVLSADAQSATPKVTKRQVAQQKRIVQGYRSGELTKKEVVRLEAQQVHIRRTKARAKADGVVTKRERARIHHKQNKASRNIYRQKHDKQQRF